MSSFTWPTSGGSGGIQTVSTFSALPPAGSNVGAVYITLDTGILYESFGGSWVAAGGPGSVLSVGTFGSTPNSNGLSITTDVLQMQPADGTHPGGVSVSAQTFAGAKTFSTAPVLSSLTASLPLQLDASKNVVSSAINLASSQVTGILPAANGGGAPATKTLFVDGLRTDTYTQTGAFDTPFKTIQAAINQIAANADNAANPYLIDIAPGSYNETLTFASSNLYNISFGTLSYSQAQVACVSIGPGTGTAITSVASNNNLANLAFAGLTINGDIIFTGDTNATNMFSGACNFVGCNIQKSTSGVLLTNLNNIYFYDTAFNTTGAGPITFNNVAFALVEQGEGLKSGTTVNLVNNNSGNQPSQFSGNYVLAERATFSATINVDAGSELDTVLAYMGGGTLTVNGTWHAYGTVIACPVVLNSGSTFRNRASSYSNTFTVNAGATVVNQTNFGYTPTTSTDFNTVPATIEAAIDTLATSGAVKSQTQNKVLASPNGSSGVPSFRALVAGDLPVGTGTVTSVSVVSANGLAGTVATATTTPALTLSTTVNAPVLAGNGTAISAATTTGSGSTVVLATSPTLITPALGTPSALVGTNITGTAAGLTAGTVTTNANLTGPITSVGNATSIASQTGTGTKFVVDTSPTILTPTISTITSAAATSLVLQSAGATALTINTSQNSTFAGSITTNVGPQGITISPTTNTNPAYMLASNAGGSLSVGIDGNAGGQFNAGNYAGAIQSGVNLALIVNAASTPVKALQISAAGVTTLSSALPIASGGTNASTANPAFNNLSPLTTKGDTLVYTTVNARQSVPGDYGGLVPDSTQSSGWRNATYLQDLQGRPGKNYIQYADFENNATTGWTLGTIGTLTNGLPTGSPTFGSGASGNLSIAVVSSNQLAGAYSLSYVSSAATTQGNMLASSAYTIDAADQAKVLTYKFYYSVPTNPSNGNFSGTSSNSFAVAAYDVTNSAFLGVAGAFNLVQSSGTGIAIGTFQTASNTASIRFIVYNANASSGAITLYLDDFYVGPQTAPMGPAMSDWVAYTPTFTGFGTVTGVSAYSRRVGDSLQVNVRFTAGTTTGVVGQVTLGYNGANANVTTDVSKQSNFTIVGIASAANATTTYFNVEVLSNGGRNYVSFGLQSSTTSIISAEANASSFCGSAQTFAFTALVPISGWSSNTVQSSDTDARVTAVRATGATATVTGTYSNLTWTTISNDSNGAFTNPGYTVPVTGYYDFIGSLYFGAASVAVGNTASVGLFNATTSSTLLESLLVYQATGNTNLVNNFAFKSVYLTAGTVIDIQVKSSATTPVINASSTANFIGISRASGPAVIQATESVNARYYNSATTISGSLATVSWTTKDFDSHNAMSAGTYTIPVSGKYQVNCFVLTAGTFALNNLIDLQLQKDGVAISEDKVYAAAAVTDLGVNVSDILNCLAGDTVRVQVSSSGTTPTIVNSNTQNWFSIARVGN